MKRLQQFTTAAILGGAALVFGQKICDQRAWESVARAHAAPDHAEVRRQVMLAERGPQPEIDWAALAQAAQCFVAACHPDLQTPLCDEPGFAPTDSTLALAPVDLAVGRALPGELEITRIAVEAPRTELQLAAAELAPRLDVVRPQLATNPQVAICLAPATLVLQTIEPAVTGNAAPEVAAVEPETQEETETPSVATVEPAVSPEQPAADAVRPSVETQPETAEPTDVAATETSPTQAPSEEVAGAETDAAQIVISDNGFVWPTPVALLDELEKLAEHADCEGWARRTAGALQKLATGAPLAHADSKKVLAELRADAAVGQGMAKGIPDRRAVVALRLTLHSLERRLDLWEATQGLLEETGGLAMLSAADSARLAEILERLHATLAADRVSGPGWRQYLLVDALGKLTLAPGSAVPGPTHRQLAQLVLERMHSPELTSEQLEFLSREPAASLAGELAHVASVPLPAERVLADIEAYELSKDPAAARKLAETCGWLVSASAPSAQKMGQSLESHYRNHNVRVAVSSHLINRLIPQPEPMNGRVRDTVLGIPVSGTQTTVSNVRVNFIPDNRAARVALVISGNVDVDAVGVSGPATLYSNTESQYRAIKPIRIDQNGIAPERAEVSVNSSLNLKGFRTDLDNVPLVGSLVRSYVASQSESQRDEAIAETEHKLQRRVAREVDTMVNGRLNVATTRLQSKMGGPLAALDFDPLLVDMQTSQDRVSIRGRLAAGEQLGSNTPRPQAMSDSLASFQVHESALNNVIDQLGLAGGTFSPAELQDMLVKKFQIPQDGLPKVIGRDLRFTFAAEEPLRVRFDEGKLHVTLKLDHIEHGRQEVEAVTVSVSYHPTVKGRSVELHRDSSIHIDADGLRGRSALLMRAVFTKMFPKERPWQIIPANVLEDQRLSDLGVTQLVLRDGWIGVSIGPARREAARVETAAKELAHAGERY